MTPALIGHSISKLIFREGNYFHFGDTLHDVSALERVSVLN
jgi:hypothetical protein